MTRTLTAIAMLATFIGASTPALAGPNVSIRPPVMVRPSIQPRVHIPSISRQVATQLQNQQTDPGHGGLTTGDHGTNAGMLLPAVLGAREPSRRSSSNASKGRIKYYQYELKNTHISN